MRELNYLLFRNSGGEKFITAFLAIYDRRTQVLEYVNAGHNDPLLLPDCGPPQLLHDGTIMLGIMEELPMLQGGPSHHAAPLAALRLHRRPDRSASTPGRKSSARTACCTPSLAIATCPYPACTNTCCAASASLASKTTASPTT
ncbi:MAG: SpoIIE family protein phosphatase [Hymenobacter sp.]